MALFRKTSTIFFGSLTLSTFTVACNPQSDLTVRAVETTEIVSELTPVEQFIAEQPPVGHPTRIALVKDETLSSETSRIPPMTGDELEPLYNLTKQNGGEIALIGLCDNSDRPALRVHIDTPPRLSPSDLKQTEQPTAPDTRGVSPFKLAEINAQHQSKLVRYQQLEQENAELFSQHQQALAQWQTDTEQKLEAFSTQLKPLLEKPATCQSSNVYSALRRADTFLNEVDGGWTYPPKNFALLVTDGLHNTDTPSVQMHSDAEILLVNGSGESGIFANFQHRSFEAVSAAVRYLVVEASTQEVSNDG